MTTTARNWPSRRAVLRQALLAASASLVYASGAAAATPPQRPDIILFVADDLSWADIAPNGSPDARTPNIDRLASEGLRFTRAFAASPTCTPSRSSILTGDYPMRHGAHANHSIIDDGLRTMPAYLKALGYRVVIAGKTDIGPRAAFPFEYLAGSSLHPDGKKNALLTKLDTAAVEKLFASRDPAQPVALFIASYQPHVPWSPNKSFDPARLTLPANFVDTPETRDARARYLTDVGDFDRELGDVRASVARHGKPSDTLFLFTGDHGAQFPFAKWNLYDPGIHVPMIAAWPGHIPAGGHTDAIISLTDILPTVVQVAGGDVPRGIDGKSFLPVLLGRQTVFRDTIFAAHTGDRNFNRSPMRAIRTDRWKLIVNLNPTQKYVNAMTENGGDDKAFWPSWMARAQSDPRARMLVERYQMRPPVELYDLKADPDELHNLADEPRARATRDDLRQRLDRWRIEQGEKLTDVPLPEDARTGDIRYTEW